MSYIIELSWLHTVIAITNYDDIALGHLTLIVITNNDSIYHRP